MAVENVVAICLDDNEQGAIDSRSMPTVAALEADPDAGLIRCTGAHGSTPLCGPVRATLHTGLRADHAGQTGNVGPHAWGDADVAAWLPPEVASMLAGKYFNDLPYGLPAADVIPSAWDRLFVLGSTRYYGWTAWRQDASQVNAGEGEYDVDRLGVEAVDFLEDVSGPFLLRIDTQSPHRAVVPATRHAALDCGGATNADDPPGWNAQIANAPAHMVYPLLSFAQRTEIRAGRAELRQALRAVDEMIASILDVLAARDLLDTTAVFLFNDNGTSWGRHRLDTETDVSTASGKRRPYGWCTDLQLRVLWPGQPSRVEPRLISSVDLVRTWLAILGGNAPMPLDGRDLTSLLDNVPGIPWRSSLEMMHVGFAADIPPWWSALWHTANWSRFWRFTEYETDEVELFDLLADPAELVNVAGDPQHADLVTFLARRLARRRALPDGRV